MSLAAKSARAVSLIALFLGGAFLFYLDRFWPHNMLVIGISLAIRYYLLQRGGDMLASLLFFGSLFVIIQFHLPWQAISPTLLTLGGLYLFFRDFLPTYRKAHLEEDREEKVQIDLPPSSTDEL